ncbi:glycosyl hydrolase family 18 protein [Aphelenchoides avenae]|nr:glycosyl hydrolase family 18 protein [Aphelenchus avenae]
MASSVANYLQSHELDGFDIDWEFPVWSEDARKTDKKGFSVLLKKLRTAFNDSGRSLLITLAVGAPYTIADKAYDIASLNSYVDYVQIMNYDFHRFRKLEPFTGFNAPLRASFFEIGPARWMTSDYSTRHWVKLGVPRSKILFGIPTYARGYHLLTKYLHFPYAPATGTSVYGDSITYPSICKIANSTDVSVVWNRAASSPYMYSGKEWLTFESERSVKEKALYARSSGVAGVMVFALFHDDFEGSCGATPFPLTKSIKAALYG